MRDANLAALLAECDWLGQVIAQIVTVYFQRESSIAHWSEIPLPDHREAASDFGRLIEAWQLDRQERLALALATAPHLRPEILDVLPATNSHTGRPFTEFGGLRDSRFSGFLPTGQTLAFLLAVGDPAQRLRALEILSPRHRFAQEGVFQLGEDMAGLPALAKPLLLSNSWLASLIGGPSAHPEDEPGFPAGKLTTPLDWSDLVLDEDTMSAVNDIHAWIKHGAMLLKDWGLKTKLKPGLCALFAGPPGTDKQLTAALLGKISGREVYRIDLARLVSSYAGGPEKNIARLFDLASRKAWILFFDDAQALSGHGDLLQRIEDYPGVVIAASDLRSNLDAAFVRRFQSVVPFAMPDAKLRLRLWRDAFEGSLSLDDAVDLTRLAEDYELTRGAILNVLHFCALDAARRGDRKATRDDIMAAIRREFEKDARLLP